MCSDMFWHVLMCSDVVWCVLMGSEDQYEETFGIIDTFSNNDIDQNEQK